MLIWINSKSFLNEYWSWNIKQILRGCFSSVEVMVRAMKKKKKNDCYVFTSTWRTHLYRSLPSSFLFRPSPPLLSGSFLSAPNRAFWSTLFCPTGGKLKAHFRYSESEHAEPEVENSKCSSRADSGQSLKHYCSWPWLISRRQAEPREAKCSALARLFWFARDVRLFDILSSWCAVFVIALLAAVVCTQ